MVWNNVLHFLLAWPTHDFFPSSTTVSTPPPPPKDLEKVWLCRRCASKGTFVIIIFRAISTAKGKTCNVGYSNMSYSCYPSSLQYESDTFISQRVCCLWLVSKWSNYKKENLALQLPHRVSLHVLASMHVQPTLYQVMKENAKKSDKFVR
jgi:hypothetical protein